MLAEAGAPDYQREEWKLPGMGFALACEFLRNLGWNGFKPRHAHQTIARKRRWLSLRQNDLFMTEAFGLADVLGSGEKGVVCNIRYSLAGLSITPDGEPASRIDNMVWLIGANIEKKRPPKEHDPHTDYLVRANS